MIARITELVKRHQHGLFIGLAMLLVSGIGYNIGRISALRGQSEVENVSASILDDSGLAKKTPSIKITQPTAIPSDPRVVASKAAGSKLYHHSWCSGAQRIKETNKLWFATENEAISAGYTLAANCQ